jgi:DNA-binding response OmpR family regulator
MKQRIYLLEDDSEVAAVIRRALEGQAYAVERFSRCAALEQALRQQEPDLCLVDLGLPDGDGLALVGEMLRRRRIPAIIVSGRSEVTDRIIGLEVGADDYITKPFEPRELVARVRAVLRRKAGSRDAAQTAARIARFGGWTANFDACTLTAPDGEAVELSSAENDLLRIFVQSAGRVLSRATLLDLNSQNDLTPFDRSIDVRVSRLRRKLREDPGAPAMIRTVYGAGYVFAPKVEWMTQPA